MGNRKLPFGYCMVQGKIVLHPQEAETIRSVYRMYLAGESFKAITAAISQGNVPYAEGRVWNKNMVARILKDQRYLGTDEYAPVITADEYRDAVDKQAQKAVPQNSSSVRKELRKMCGEKVPDWLEPTIICLLQELCKNPDMVSEPKTQTIIFDGAIRELHDDLSQLMDQVQPDEENVKNLIFKIAAAKFEQIETRGYETIRIQRYLTAAKEEADYAVILRSIAEKITLYAAATASVTLKNGQTIERRRSI